MADILKADRKVETLEFVQLLDELNLNQEEQKIILGFMQGIKLAKDMERHKKFYETKTRKYGKEKCMEVETDKYKKSKSVQHEKNIPGQISMQNLM